MEPRILLSAGALIDLPAYRLDPSPQIIVLSNTSESAETLIPPAGDTTEVAVIAHATLEQNGIIVEHGSRAPLQLAVTYVGVPMAALNTWRLHLVGPDGSDRMAQLASLTPQSDSSTVVAHYELEAPEGGWSQEQAGNYQVELTTGPEPSAAQDPPPDRVLLGTVQLLVFPDTVTVMTASGLVIIIGSKLIQQDYSVVVAGVTIEGELSAFSGRMSIPASQPSTLVAAGRIAGLNSLQIDVKRPPASRAESMAVGLLISAIPRRAVTVSQPVLLWPVAEEGGPGTRRIAVPALTRLAAESSGRHILTVVHQEVDRAMVDHRPAHVAAGRQHIRATEADSLPIPMADQPTDSLHAARPARADGASARPGRWQSAPIDITAVGADSHAPPRSRMPEATDDTLSHPPLLPPHHDAATISISNQLEAPVIGPTLKEQDPGSLRIGSHWLRLCVAAILGVVTGSTHFRAVFNHVDNTERAAPVRKRFHLPLPHGRGSSEEMPRGHKSGPQRRRKKGPNPRRWRTS